MKHTNFVTMFIFLQIAVMCSCDFLYSPQPQPAPETGSRPVTQSVGGTYSATVYHVNRVLQTCNPSIAPEGMFNGCMLFLGYDELAVSVPDSLSDYDANNVAQHDRLTIVDTVNTVRWYIMSNQIQSGNILQCPEWSTHTDYLVCLSGNTGGTHSLHAVRISDHSSLALSNKHLDEFSYPHLFIAPAANYSDVPKDPEYLDNGFCTQETVRHYFGTDSIVIVYSLPSESGTLYYVDYRATDSPHPVALLKPEDREEWYCSSPLISPDGGWVTYHCFTNASSGLFYESYLQRIDRSASPVKIAEGASDPHWWVHPITGEYSIIYSVTPGSYYNEHDFTSVDGGNDAGGYTLRISLSGTWKNVPAHAGHLAPDSNKPPDTLLHLPFKGGMSKDGYYMATAYKYAYIGRFD